MRESSNLKAFPDDELLRRLSEILTDSRRVEADLVAHIAEVDARKLYAREAAPSMFVYCTEVLHLSEPEAALRIRVARASRKHPMLLTMLREGRLHLSGIALLAPLLTRQNREALLRRATHKSKRQIEEIAAGLRPKPYAPAVVRRLPTRREETPEAQVRAPRANEGSPGDSLPCPGAAGVPTPVQRPDAVAPVNPQRVGSSSSEQRPDAVASPDSDSRPRLVGDRSTSAPPARPATAEPVGPARFRVRFDASAELREKLERLQTLMRSSVPDGDLAKIIDIAVTRELGRLEAKRFAKTKAPRKRLGQTDTRPKSRYIPAAVRRFVQKRDGGRCTYRDKHGRRCSKRHDLEFHHRKPFGRGGEHSPEVLCLMCKTHNLLLAEQDFGKEKMARYRRRASRDTKPVNVVGDRSGQGGLLAQWRSSLGSGGIQRQEGGAALR